MRQSVNNEFPSNLTDMFKYNRDVNHYETRQSDDLFVPMHRTNIRKFSVAVHGAKVWNSIPCKIKNATSVSCFKYKFFGTIELTEFLSYKPRKY